MSTTAMFFVLFKSQPTKDRLLELEAIISNRVDMTNFCQLEQVDESDLYASINDDGSLEFLNTARCRPLIGIPSIQNLLYKSWPGRRLWADWYPDGPAAAYVITLLVLLSQPDIAGVWYGDEKYHDGVTIPATTKESALKMLDDFIRIGHRD